MNIFKYLLAAFIISSFALTANALDLPGSKDPAGIKRYAGSEIIRYDNLAFERFTIPLGKMTSFDFGTKEAHFENSRDVEGELFRVSYHVPDDKRSSLEIIRNYEADLTAAGWQILWKASGKPQYGNSFTHIYEALRGNDQLFTYNDAQGHVLVAEKPSEGLIALVFATKFDMGLTGGIKITKGDPIIQVDLVRTKSMDQRMEVVSASEMSKAIGETGRVALYGIYFDFNSARVKDESKPTLNQIAKFLASNPSIHLLVVGHTDNVGGFDSNLRLSSDRAASVVESLAGQFGVQKARLKPFGVSYAAPISTNQTEDGRAKNRRVELVEMSAK